MGEHSNLYYGRALDVVTEAYDELLGNKITVEDERVIPKSKSLALPIRATPSNIADLALMRAVTLAVSKPDRWKKLLPDAICVARHYWELCGPKLEAPGRGTWKRIIDESFDNSDPSHCTLATLINNWHAPPLPPSLRTAILSAAKKLADLRQSL